MKNQTWYTTNNGNLITGFAGVYEVRITKLARGSYRIALFSFIKKQLYLLCTDTAKTEREAKKIAKDMVNTGEPTATAIIGYPYQWNASEHRWTRSNP